MTSRATSGNCSVGPIGPQMPAGRSARGLSPGGDVFERLGQVEVFERVVEPNCEAGPRQAGQIVGRQSGGVVQDFAIERRVIPPIRRHFTQRSDGHDGHLRMIDQVLNIRQPVYQIAAPGSGRTGLEAAATGRPAGRQSSVLSPGHNAILKAALTETVARHRSKKERRHVGPSIPAVRGDSGELVPGDDPCPRADDEEKPKPPAAEPKDEKKEEEAAFTVPEGGMTELLAFIKEASAFRPMKREDLPKYQQAQKAIKQALEKIQQVATDEEKQTPEYRDAMEQLLVFRAGRRQRCRWRT